MKKKYNKRYITDGKRNQKEALIEEEGIMNRVSENRERAGSISHFQQFCILILCLAVVLPSLRAFSISAEAGVTWPVFGAGQPVLAYTANPEKKYPVYNKSHSKIKGLMLSSSSPIRIIAIDGKWAAFLYSTNGTTKTGYVPLSTFTAVAIPQNKETAQAETTVYRRDSGSKTAGRITAGSTLYTLASAGSRVQILYSVRNSSGNIRNWQMGWVNRSDHNKLLTVMGASTLRITGVSRPTVLQQGSFFTVTGTVSSNYNIKEVRVAIRNAAYNVVSKRYTSTNTKSFSLSLVDKYILFNKATPGKNYYIIWAKDAKGKTVLMNMPFTVVKKTIPTAPSSGRAGGPSYFLGYDHYSGVNYKGQTSSSRRIAALNKAKKMVTIKWKCPMNFPTWYNIEGYYSYAKAKDGTVSTQFLKGKTYVGIPYSMKNHSYDNEAWANVIKKGYTWKEMAAPFYSSVYKTAAKGSDCSYFVYLCMRAGGANVTYQTTYTMSNGQYYKRIDKSRMKPGDVLLCSHHTMLFAGRVGSRYAVFESTSDGATTRYKLFTAAELAEYSAYRYKYW